MENQLSSSASCQVAAFPSGLRVLVVDDDPTWLKILEKMLRKCNYEVTTCCLARVALDLLRERRDRFDIVISDVNMPDMDGFKLLEHVGLEMDLPVIMMSVDGETSRVMKGVQHGACDYLLKPVRMKELRNIWQHVFRKKIHEIKETDSYNSNEDFQAMRTKFEEFEEMQMLYGGDLNVAKKRKDNDNREHVDQDLLDPSSVKKARVVWSVDLHQKFVNAVNHIGFDKVGPKKILDMMNVPGLTRENVASHLQLLTVMASNINLDLISARPTRENAASHLQKYRLYLSRLQKQDGETAFQKVSQPDPFPKDHQGKFSSQSSKAVPLNNFSNERIHAQATMPEVSGDEFNCVPSQTETSRMAPDITDTDPLKVKQVAQSGAIFPLESLAPIPTYNIHETKMSNFHSWIEKHTTTQFVQYSGQDQGPIHLPTDYQYQEHQEENLGGDDHYSSTSSVAQVFSTTEQDASNFFHIKPCGADKKRNIASSMLPVACTIDSMSVQIEQGAVNSRQFGGFSVNIEPSNVKGYSADQYLLNCFSSSKQKTNLKEQVVISSSPKDLICSLQGYGCFDNATLNSMDILECNSTMMTDIQTDLYDGLLFDSDYMFELMEYPTIDGGLFT